MEKDISCKWKKQTKQNPRVAVFTSEEIDFKTKTILRDKEGHYLMIKGTMQQEDITLVNMCPPNGGALKYVKQILA